MAYNGKYLPLKKYFENLTTDKDIKLSFNYIEKELKIPLPPYAKEYKPRFWSNDISYNHHAISWLDAGWKVKEIKSNEIIFEKNSNIMLPKFQKTRKDKIDKSEMYLDCLLEIFKDIEYQKLCIDKCKKEYRLDDAGRIFYKFN